MRGDCITTVSENIQKLRLRRKITEAQLADRLHVAEQDVYSWENGETEPGIDMLGKIADSLDTDIFVLTSGAQNAKARKQAVRQLITVCIITLILGVAAYFFTPYAEKMKSSYYELGPYLALRVFLLPLLWVMAGWAAAHILAMAGVVRPARSAWRKPIFIIVLIVVLLYAVLMLPLVIDLMYGFAQFLHFYNNRSLNSSGFQYSSHLPTSFLLNTQWAIMAVVNKQSAVFLLPGLLLRLTKPIKRT